MKKYIILMSPLLCILLFTQNSKADYIATGEIKGTVCKGFVIEVCGPQKIDAEKGSDGKLHPFPKRFTAVQKFIPKVRGGNTGDCTFYDTKSWPTYQLQKDGSYERIKADYIQFKCKKE